MRGQQKTAKKLINFSSKNKLEKKKQTLKQVFENNLNVNLFWNIEINC